MTIYPASGKWLQTGAVPVQLIAALAVAAAAFGAGWTVQGWRGSAALAALQTQHAQAAQATTEANARHLVRVWERGDELATSLASQQSRITKLHQEHTREINRLTTGRACLSAELVGVLNRTQPTATDGPDALPTSTCQAALLRPMPAHLPPMQMSGTGLRAPASSTQSALPGLDR